LSLVRSLAEKIVILPERDSDESLQAGEGAGDPRARP
jgi:hypothetical protein